MPSHPAGSAYRTVAHDLREALLRHTYADGAPLPTEAELAERYRVSRQTVRRAFHDLVSEGLVFRVPGRGTFATTRDARYLRQFGSVEDLMGLAVDTVLDVVDPLQRRVDPGMAARLGLSVDEVDHVSFTRRQNAVPFCFTQVWLPPAIGALLADAPELTSEHPRTGATVIGLLDRRLAQPISEADQSITVGRADAEHARVLGVDAGTALLRIDRTYLDLAGQPVELATSHFLPELYSYRVRLRRSAD